MNIFYVVGSLLVLGSITKILLLLKKFKPNKITELNQYEKEIIIKRVNSLEPHEFEKFCANIYELLGFETHLTPQTNDGGKDIVLKKGGEKIFVECKHFKESNSVGRPVAQKLCGAMVANNISKGVILTLKGDNNNCKRYCKSIKNKKIKIDSIEVINIIELLEMCSNIESNKILNLLNINFNNE